MYWVADQQGRVLGPTQLQTLRELVESGRLKDIAQVSRDGRTWVAAELVPEIEPLLVERTPEAVASTEREQVLKVRDYLHRIQGMPAHDIFRVPEGASLSEYRAAFFSVVKRFYPDNQPSAELRHACENVFLYLAALMVNLERSERAKPRTPALAPPAPVTKPPLPPRSYGRAARESPTYEPAEFVGLRWSNERVEAKLRIQRKHVPMFTDHPLANFNMNSVFVPGSHVVPLGTLMELTLEFEEPSGHIQTRGKVFWENSGNDPRQPSGFGVRLFTLTPKDQEFIRAFIRGR